ncbi:MAG: hypothetical protein ABIU97_02940 [Dehalococcoidia bacterium]
MAAMGGTAVTEVAAAREVRVTEKQATRRDPAPTPEWAVISTEVGAAELLLTFNI